jgi:recombination protein RecA
VASPFKQTEFDIIYNEGISAEGEILALGEKFGLIEKSGANFSYMSPVKGAKGEDKREKISLGRGYDASRTFLRDKANEPIRTKVLKEIRDQLENGGLSFVGKEEPDEAPEE